MIREFLSVSQLLRFVGCEFDWHQYYREQWRPLDRVFAPDLGSVAHAGMAAALRAQWHGTKARECHNAAIKAVAERVAAETEKTLNNPLLGVERMDEHEEMLNEISIVAPQVVVRALEWLPLSKWKTQTLGTGPAVEAPLTMDLPGWLGFQGFVDWVASFESGVWLVDWKFRNTLQPVESDEFNLQNSIYQEMLARHGVFTTGSDRIQIKNSVSKVPTLNKDGSMSRTDIASTWDVYKATLKANKLDPKDYEEMKEKLDAKEWQRRSPVYLNPLEANAIWETVVVPVARRIAMMKEHDLPALRTGYGGFRCPRCWMREWCLAEVRGHSTESIALTQFRKREKSEPKRTKVFKADLGGQSGKN
jgi:hypothetical protein